MPIRVAINGFGRIGRNVLRAARRDGADIDFVALNDLADARTLAHLLRHDSVHGAFDGIVEVDDAGLRVDGERIRICSERDPEDLPWGELDVDVVLECTGRFRSREDAGKHLKAGASKVIISAPAKDPDATFCLGVNQADYDPGRHHVVSNASCTTNCLAPVAKVLHDSVGFQKGWMTTIHAYTTSQNLLDGPHKDLRRARAAALSMVPTSTGAARALGLVLPELDGKVDGCAVRVPTADVSLVDLVVQVGRETTAEEINGLMRDAAAGPMKGILDVAEEPLVSIDYAGNPHSSVVDPEFTRVVEGDLVQLVSWYDNEMGYSTRLVELAALVGGRM